MQDEPPPELIVRAAAKDDRRSLQRFDCCADGDGPAYAKLVRSTIRRRGYQAKQKDERPLIALYDGDVVGSALHCPGEFSGETARFVMWLAICQTWHGRSLPDGRRLSDAFLALVVAHAKDEMLRRGEGVLYAKIDPANEASQRVVGRNGWQNVTDIFYESTDQAEIQAWATTIDVI
jgi:hypothetical protein